MSAERFFDVLTVLGVEAATYTERARLMDGSSGRARVIREMHEKNAARLIETRAAVAELIEAVGAVYGEPCVDEDQAADDPCTPECMSCRIRAALARCRGAA